jgi:nitrate/nitrite transport system ATP-binding protein
MSTLRIDNAGFRYGRSTGSGLILRDISLNIAEGDFVSLIGFSGTGKTTLQRVHGGETRDRPRAGPRHRLSKLLAPSVDDRV